MGLAKESLKVQVGGSHYKNLVMQPIELIVNLHCNFIQGCIIKYISRYKHKNGAEDIKKCIHYAELALDLMPESLGSTVITGPKLIYNYVYVNGFNSDVHNVILAVYKQDWDFAIRFCKLILEREYGYKNGNSNHGIDPSQG